MNNSTFSYGDAGVNVSPGFHTRRNPVPSIKPALIENPTSLVIVFFFRVAWRQSQWGFWATNIFGTKLKAIVAFIIDPPQDFIRRIGNKQDFQLFASLELYFLWDLHNKAKFSK